MKVQDFFTKQNIALDKDISLYVCGPTVYNHPHIGNMRPIVIFDIFNRIASLKNNVTFIHNITDVDDKIIDVAIKNNISEKEVALKFEAEYLDLLKELNIIIPTHMPRVTDNIDGIIQLIQELIEKGHAYEVKGSIYFSVDSFKEYGKLDNISLDMLIENESMDFKKNPKDFALWKSTTEGVKFKSPWGDGRPGWHTECTFFIKKYFGNNGIDIHGGGIDLKFPHHINEIAQYEAITSNDLAKAWNYVGHLTVDDVKMSKSENNFITAKDFIKEYGANVLRYILISTNALKPINLTNDVILNAQNTLQKIENTLRKVLIDISMNEAVEIVIEPSNEFIKILENNLNIPKGITYLLETAKTLNRNIEISRKEKLIGEFIANLLLIGFKYEINFDSLKNKIRIAKQNFDYETLDKLKKEIIK